MRIEQNHEFKPITITLENSEEAELFWQLLRHGSTKRTGALNRFANMISDWFSNHANL